MESITYLKYFLFAFLFYSLLNCGFYRANSIPNTTQNMSIDSILKEWKIDSLGCKGLRSDSKAMILRDSFNLENQYPRLIIGLLGKPNNYIFGKDYYVIRYYCQTSCNNGIILDKVEHCWVDFIYKDSLAKKCKMLPTCP